MLTWKPARYVIQLNSHASKARWQLRHAGIYAYLLSPPAAAHVRACPGLQSRASRAAALHNAQAKPRLGLVGLSMISRSLLASALLACCLSPTGITIFLTCETFT